VLNTYYNAGDGAAGYMEWPQSWYWNQQTNEITRCYLFGNTAYSNSGSRPDLQKRSTAGHEMGHCLGIDHSDVSNALMRTGRNREVIFSPWQDDVNAINAKYGVP
jgi:predicted Zn-dependent protease